MFLREVFLVFIGLSAGGIIAAGVFAFLVIIGVFPRLIGAFGGNLALGIYGLSVGIFVGILVMSLAETLKALPVIGRRINLAVGLQYLILSLGIGKLIGSLIYFTGNFGQ